MGSATDSLLLDAGAAPQPRADWKIVVTIIKCFIGSGVLFLPKAFSNGGWLFSSVSFVACALLTNVCVTKLIACRGVMPPGSDYGAIGQRVAGRWGAAAVNASLVLSQAGFCCVYISFVARNLIQLFNDGPHGCWVAPSALWVFIGAEFLVLAPLTWIRRLTSFALTNLLANAIILSGILGILVYSAAGMAAATAPHGAAAFPPPLAPMAPKWPIMLGTAVYAFEGAGMVVPMVNELPPSDRARFPRIFALTLAGVSTLYLVVGLVPYMYLVGYGASPDCAAGRDACVADTITLNLPHVWWSYCLTAGYCLALVFSYPLMMFPAIKVLEAAALPRLFPATFGAGLGGGGGGAAAGHVSDEEGEEEARGRVGAGPEAGAAAAPLSALAAEELADQVLGADEGAGMWKRNAFRSGVVAVTLLVAYVGAPQLDNMVSLIGAFCCTPMCVFLEAGGGGGFARLCYPGSHPLHYRAPPPPAELLFSLRGFTRLWWRGPRASAWRC